MPIDLNLPKKAGLFVAGTGDGAGKTLVAGAIARILADKDMKVGVFKPIATGCRRSWEGVVNTETEFLANCANSDLALSTITPVGYSTAGVPLVSALCDGAEIDFDAIATAYSEICASSDVVIVEGVGGVRVPLTAGLDLLDLAVEFGLPLVIVARWGPDVINHTLMTIDCVRAAQLKIGGVVVNGYKASESTEAMERAEEVISRCGDIEILSVVPFDEMVDIKENSLGEFVLPTLTDCDWVSLSQG
jgi:dethiobiotin synthetase